MNIYLQKTLYVGLIGALSYLLMWNLEPRHYLIILNNLWYWIVGLLIISLWFDTRHIRISSEWWVLFALIGIIGFLSTQSSTNYLISSIKIKLDFFIISLGFLLYAVLKDRLIDYAAPILLIIVLVFIVGSVPTSLPEIFVENESRQGLWSVYYDPASMFSLTFYNHLRHFSYHAFIALCCAYILLRHFSESVGNAVEKSPNKHFLNTVLIFFLWLILLVCYIAVILAYGRASLVALVVFVGIDVYLRHDLKKAIQSALCVSAIILLTYLILYYSPLGSISELFFSSFLKGQNKELLDGVNSISSGRLVMWIKGLQAVQHSPVYGLGSSSAVWAIGDVGGLRVAHPHNTFIQLIMDYGFLGAAIIIYTLIKFFKQFIVKLPVKSVDESLRRSLLAFVLAYFVFAIFDGVFYHPYPMLHFSIIVAILSALHFNTINGGE